MEHSLDDGLRLLRLGVDTHLITEPLCPAAAASQPGGLVVERPTARPPICHALSQFDFYDVVKTTILRLGWALAQELAPHGATAVTVTPGWLRSEIMLDGFGVTDKLA